MIIDLHFHTEAFSSCSRIPLLEGVKRAKEIGLDGICLTEHDVFHENRNIKSLASSLSDYIREFSKRFITFRILE